MFLILLPSWHQTIFVWTAMTYVAGCMTGRRAERGQISIDSWRHCCHYTLGYWCLWSGCCRCCFHLHLLILQRARHLWKLRDVFFFICCRTWHILLVRRLEFGFDARDLASEQLAVSLNCQPCQAHGNYYSALYIYIMNINSYEVEPILYNGCIWDNIVIVLGLVYCYCLSPS